MIDGNPWFVAADVCAALGIGNNRMAVEKLDDDEKGVSSIDTLGGQQEMLVVNESGLNAIILRCRDAMTTGTVAHRYRKWVTSEVLPAIRKTGSYHAVAPAPTSDAAHETIAPKDMGNLTRLVWLICNGLWGDSAWTQAVWFRLRKVTGCAAPNRFHVRHLPILASEVRRIFCMVQAFKDAEREAGRLLIKKVLRGGAAEGPVLEEAKRLMAEAVAADEAELGKLMERWHEHEIAALEARKADGFRGGYFDAYKEPKALQ